MKAVILALGLLAIFIGVLVYLRQRRVEPPPMIVSSTGPTIERLERLSNLCTGRVYVADVLVGQSDSSRGAWMIRGDGLIAVDLSKAVIVEKDEAAKRAVTRWKCRGSAQSTCRSNTPSRRHRRTARDRPGVSSRVPADCFRADLRTACRSVRRLVDRGTGPRVDRKIAPLARPATGQGCHAAGGNGSEDGRK